MGMTNKMLKELIDNHGRDIFAIFLDNEQKVLFGYNSKDCPKIEDLTLDTLGGQDVFKIKRGSHSQNKPVYFTTIHLTDSIQWVGIMDEVSKDYRVDPLIFR